MITRGAKTSNSWEFLERKLFNRDISNHGNTKACDHGYNYYFGFFREKRGREQCFKVKMHRSVFVNCRNCSVNCPLFT